MSQHLTLLGLGAMAFYAVMLATDNVSLELMPQFLTSAIIFLSSGRIMKMAARSLAKDEEEKEKEDRPSRETDWPWLTALLNWNAALVLIGIMAIFLMKPAGVSLMEVLSSTLAPATFTAGTVP
jgi:hypothetical protein